jgi:hypothetical protein
MFESKRDVQAVNQTEFMSILLLAICFYFGEKPLSGN